jgi:hypothetical protein
MLSRGAVQALNLDGGGSTTMAVRLPGDLEVSVVNRPSDGSERAVANSLRILTSAPTGPLAYVNVVPGTTTLAQGQIADFVAKGQDASNNGVTLADGEVTWSLIGPGSISAAGRYSATATGSATVVATARGIQGTATVTVGPPVDPRPPQSVRLDISAASALGLRPPTGYTTKTPKVQATGRYVTWKFTGGTVMAGQRVNILVAKKLDGAWGSPAYLRSAWADAEGTVTFAWRLRSAGAVNVRIQWPGGGTYGVSTSAAHGAYWR